MTRNNVISRVLLLRTEAITSRFLWTLCCAIVLTGCASNIPEQIRQPTAGDIKPAEAGQQPGTFAGQMVRWGGEIISIENRPQYTQITVLAKPLDKDGEPQKTNKHFGRFIAQLERFIEPSLYAPGRNVTVFGRFTHTVDKMVDQYPYRYPVVMIDTLYLWPLPPEPQPDYWYDPWYPWGPWNYYPHSHHHVKPRSTEK